MPTNPPLAPFVLPELVGKKLAVPKLVVPGGMEALSAALAPPSLAPPSTLDAPIPPPVDPRHTNSATMIMGDTGTGKTLLAGTFALWLWNTYGLKTRYYLFDPGGIPDYVVALVEMGIVSIWRPITRDPDSTLGLVLGTIDRATQGYWPARVNPHSGDAAEMCDLIPPSTVVHVLECPQGHDVRSAPTPQMLMEVANCPKCGTPTTFANCRRVRQDTTVTPGFEQYGGVVFDGLTSMGTWALTDVNYRAGMDMLGGIKGATRTQVSDGIIYGSAGMSGVGFAQERIWEWIRNACTIRGLVRPPLFTALKNRGADDGVLIYGPMVPGKAKTAQVPNWFGHCLGTETVTPPNSPIEYRLYLRSYVVPPDLTRHLVKVRIASLGGALPEYLIDPPGATLDAGTQFSRFSMGYFYELFDQAVAKVQAVVGGKLKRPAPGVGDGVLPEAAQRLALRARPTGAGAGAPPGMQAQAVAGMPMALPTGPVALPQALPPGMMLPPGLMLKKPTEVTIDEVVVGEVVVAVTPIATAPPTARIPIVVPSTAPPAFHPTAGPKLAPPAAPAPGRPKNP